jgi:hypothetical protein
MPSLDDLQGVLVFVMRLLLWGGAGVVLVVGMLMIRDMDAGSRSQGGVIYVAGAMIIVLGLIAGKLASLPRRKAR